MARNYLICFAIAIVAVAVGCAQRSIKTVVFRDIRGDVWVRSIDTDNVNQAGSAGTDIQVDSGAAPGYAPPIRIGVSGRGIFADSSVYIESVSGSVYIEEAGNRNQEQEIEPALRALFLPGNPFNVQVEGGDSIE